MKRGKNEEKNIGPMFPRLHVNDTEKGGPKAPPRNKMALYEQLSIPSHRLSPGMLSLNPNNATGPVPPVSSTQGNGHERGMFFPLQRSPSLHQAENTRYSDMDTPLAQLDPKRKLAEDDFKVPILVHSGTSQDHSKYGTNTYKEKLSSLSPAYPIYSMKLQGANNTKPKRINTIGFNSSQEERRQSDERSQEFVKPASNLLSREKTQGPLKRANTCSSYERKNHPKSSFNRLQKTDVSLRQDNIYDDSISNEIITGVAHGHSSIRLEGFQLEQRSPNGPINDTEFCEGRSLPTGDVERGDDVSEASMVDSESGLHISPDDVVGIIGQKHFWKARRTIVNQQRVFAVQVFELHRLIKVQRLIAESSNILLEDNAYLGKPLKGSSANAKNEDDLEKPTHMIERSDENAVGKTSPPVQNASSNHRPVSGNPPPPADTNAVARFFHQPPMHQWLIPVMSPSEGLIYKPYPGPGFMSPGCGPPGSTPVMDNFSSPGYVASYGYFPPYGMPIMNRSISGSAVEQTNRSTGPNLHGQLSGEGADLNIQQESSASTQKNAFISNDVKLHTYKDSELQVSTSNSPSGKVQGTETGGRNVLRLFPTYPAVDVSGGAPQHQKADRPARVIKVVPRNAGSATEFAARIFRSIQEERKQYD